MRDLVSDPVRGAFWGTVDFSLTISAQLTVCAVNDFRSFRGAPQHDGGGPHHDHGDEDEERVVATTVPNVVAQMEEVGQLRE